MFGYFRVVARILAGSDERGSYVPTVYTKDAASLFSTAVFRPVLEGREAVKANALVARLRPALALRRTDTNSAVMTAAYDALRREYRSEYFYKNLITNKIFIGRHRASNSVLLPEFKVRDSVADCVFVNGLATVYEIKTEYDSPDKLMGQIENYYRAFTLVNVVAHEGAVERYRQFLAGLPVGLIAVGSRDRLSVVEQAQESVASLDIKAMFDCLRLPEVTSILERAFGGVPDVPNGVRYSAYLEQAGRMGVAGFHAEMRRVLKVRSLRNCRGLVLDTQVIPMRTLLVQLDPNQRQQQNLARWLATKGK